MTRALAAATIALVAFLLYHSTLLPGFDLGDTASFQAEAAFDAPTPRQAYPLYFTVGRLAIRAIGGDPARALNLTSAMFGALACGATVWVGSLLAGSVGAGVFAGLLLASSYTFWSQAIIAEVYTLHVLLVAICCAALLEWERRPSLPRLGLFIGLYALSFGHHLSMILLALPFLLFLLLTARRNLRAVLGLQPVVLAGLLAAFASLQYLTSLHSLWLAPDPPANLREGLQAFWFDVTKSDWRESMVLAVHPSALADRLSMWWFDLRQQFGIAGVVLAIAGLASLRSAARISLLVTGYIFTAAFAFGYNVGDVHVFFLTSHLMVVLLAGCGVAAIGRVATDALTSRPYVGGLLTLALLAYPVWRVWDSYPALDRSADLRPRQVLDDLTAGLSGRNAILGADLNWQLQNGLGYYSRYHRADLPFLRMAEHMLQAPFLIHDNQAIGRDFVLTEGARARLIAAFGPRYQVGPDPRVTARSLAATVAAITPTTTYALSFLTPTRDAFLDAGELDSIVRHLTGGAIGTFPDGHYVTMVGLAGQAPVLVRASDRPFRDLCTVSGIEIDVRMESWLSTDTIRRAGFGHVIANRRHALIVERGLSLVTLAPDGTAGTPVYAGNIYQPQPRFLLGLGQI